MIIDTGAWALAGFGGVLIGLASVALLYFNGRIAGISGITDGVFGASRGDVGWRAAFVAGLVVGGVALLAVYPAAFPSAEGAGRPVWLLVGAGLLVGFGTRMGSGCTSGHGVCGMSRLSPRSFAATAMFMFTGGVSVALVRHLLGGAL